MMVIIKTLWLTLNWTHDDVSALHLLFFDSLGDGIENSIYIGWLIRSQGHNIVIVYI